MKKNEKLFHGALWFEEAEGYLVARRFTRAQMDAVSYEAFFLERTRCQASITIELCTEATEISFSYKFLMRSGVLSTFEVYTNGCLTHLYYDDTLADEGRLSLSFEGGKKHIEIYLPNYSEVGIKDFFANGKYRAVTKKKPKVLFFGDSITQGGGSKRSAQTYVNVLKREMGYEILNLGIGGYVFENNLVKEMPFSPDKIVVALGTNHHGLSEEESRARITSFFDALTERYGDMKKLVLLPVYCGNPSISDRKEKYKRLSRTISQIAGRYPNVQIVNAYDMIPHFADYYMEDFVHPNALGMELYGKNLAKAIRKIKF